MADESLVLHLDGFDGPLDLLLDLARGQKLDLARISILSLVEQYLAIVEGARRVRLELAADWLVMAAWLTWLKSRLLLPPGTEAAEEGEEAADILAGPAAGAGSRARGGAGSAGAGRSAATCSPAARPKSLVAIDRSGLAADLPGLLRAYTAARRRMAAKTHIPAAPGPAVDGAGCARPARPAARPLPRLDRARAVPAAAAAPTPASAAAARASTLLAGLELARSGRAICGRTRSSGQSSSGRCHE